MTAPRHRRPPRAAGGNSPAADGDRATVRGEGEVVVAGWLADRMGAR